MRTLLILQPHSHSVLLHILIVCSHEIPSVQGAAYVVLSALLTPGPQRLALSRMIGSQSSRVCCMSASASCSMRVTGKDMMTFQC